MKVVDLFSGLNGWSAPFKDRGHETFTVDIDERFDSDLHADVRRLKPRDFPWQPDVVLASPPCDAFSVMNINKNWTIDNEPKTEKAEEALWILVDTLNLIGALKPKYWIIENPRDKMRKLPHLAMYERRTVTYCQYGEKRMKPTDLFGVFPPSLQLIPACNNGDPCHVRAPRGSSTGTQGMDRYLSAKIPYALAEAICIAMEHDI